MAPRFCFGLKASQKELSCIFFVVRTLVSDEKDGQIARQIRHLFGDDIEMLGGMKGQGNATFGSKFARPHSARNHNFVGADFAVLQHDTPNFSVLNDKPFDRRFFKYLSTPHPRALGHGLGHVGGVYLPVIWHPDPAR